jgi:hypothetical protein
MYIYIQQQSDTTSFNLLCFFEAVILEIVWIVNFINVNYLEHDL